MTTKTTIDEMPIEQLHKNAARALDLIAEIEGLLPGLVLFTVDDRSHSDGRVRNEGEAVALRAVLATIEHDPAAFRVLGNRADAEDVLRETLLRAVQGFERFEYGAAGVWPWLRRIAIQRRGRRISFAWLSSSVGATASSFRSKSGW